MTGFSVDFLGCKISHTDAEAVRDALLTAGHSEHGAAAIRVVNTCCITAEAEKKSRQRVRRHAGAVGVEQVFVTGCGAQLNPESYEVDTGTVTVLGGGVGLSTARIVEAADSLAGIGCVGSIDPATEQQTAPGARSIRRTRAFIKVQDGCSFTCSYCIVPTVRGTSRSRTLEAVLADIQRRVDRHQHEIVLTGVNIGLYRDPELRASLPTLVRRVAAVDGVRRVRISSIEVNHVSPRLVDAIASMSNVCPHLHVPLQSGDDDVLRDMGRHYLTRRYRAAIEHARERIPELNLTTDIIVGYPTEDDDSFERTRAFCAEMGFTKIHAFPFSPRPGTVADAASDPVPRHVKRERSALLRADADARARARWASRIGALEDVLVEVGGSRTGMALTSQHEAAPGSATDARTAVGGYTRDYCPVRISGDVSRLVDGTLARVRVISSDERGLVAEPV